MPREIAPPQLDLNWQPKAHARRRGPETSFAAAISVRDRAPNHASRILEALKRRNGTFSHIATDTGLTEAQVWRRLSDLQNAGLAVPTDSIVDGKRVWTAV